MSSVKPPNHSTTSQPDVFQGSQYGIVNTQSYFQCNGVGGDQANNFEVMLSTNTTIKNGLEAGKYYLIIKKMITTTNRNPPVITGNQISAATVPLLDGVALKIINKAGIVALGRVDLSNEVLNDLEDRSTCLEGNCYQAFQVKYVIPGTKNLRKTFKIYQSMLKQRWWLLQGHGVIKLASAGQAASGSPAKSGHNL
ncbi:hypothetical protein PCANC_24362 [Puccinia coronata f. sp. avenae]|uniref:Uncharacterized protein n=1 Tax=Puccinia coronata f. sp. avenae TaxID=200324 RepID=A0A2N5SKP4_9BASI|nr:hypothetical protein PCASD_22201 [Puccinia coronata f. sp. avenae]PLW29425.1 hypothetical protein PCANC_24362 [Puccinia coronata f. sp. avenae]